jgi:hypothetical protein
MHAPQPTPSMQVIGQLVPGSQTTPPPLQVWGVLPTQRTAPGAHVHFLGVALLPPQVKPLSQADEHDTVTPQLFGTDVLQSSPGSPEHVVPSGSCAQQLWSASQI